MQITRNTLDTGAGPADWFTGTVYIDTITSPEGDWNLGAAAVHFTPGARTAWHTHPLGQTIWVTEGVGLCQREGGPIEVIRPGDRVFFEPGENHWHGAAPTASWRTSRCSSPTRAAAPSPGASTSATSEYAQATEGGRLMRGVVMHSPGDVRVEEREDPKIIEPTDAIIRLAATCICGSDLWPYRGAEPVDHLPMGHEYVGVVEEIGSEVKTMKPGDFVVGSFVISDNTCEICQAGIPVEVRPRRVRARDDRHPGRAGAHPVRRRHPRRRRPASPTRT